MADQYLENNRQVATWLSTKDYATLQHLAFKNNVSTAAYVRAIIVDAIEEEGFKKPVKQQLKIQLASKVESV